MVLILEICRMLLLRSPLSYAAPKISGVEILDLVQASPCPMSAGFFRHEDCCSATHLPASQVERVG